MRGEGTPEEGRGRSGDALTRQCVQHCDSACHRTKGLVDLRLECAHQRPEGRGVRGVQQQRLQRPHVSAPPATLVTGRPAARPLTCPTVEFRAMSTGGRTSPRSSRPQATPTRASATARASAESCPIVALAPRTAWLRRASTRQCGGARPLLLFLTTSRSALSPVEQQWRPGEARSPQRQVVVGRRRSRGRTRIRMRGRKTRDVHDKGVGLSDLPPPGPLSRGCRHVRVVAPRWGGAYRCRASWGQPLLTSRPLARLGHEARQQRRSLAIRVDGPESAVRGAAAGAAGAVEGAEGGPRRRRARPHHRGPAAGRHARRVRQRGRLGLSASRSGRRAPAPSPGLAQASPGCCGRRRCWTRRRASGSAG